MQCQLLRTGWRSDNICCRFFVFYSKNVVKMDKLKNKNFHLYTFDAKRYILDYVNVFYSEISEELYREFSDIENMGLPDYIVNDCDESQDLNRKMIRQLYDQEIFFSRRVVNIPLTYNEAFITMAPIHACNLQCKYCFARQGENYVNKEKIMPEEKLAAALEYIYFDYFKNIFNFRFDFVSGGEPLLNFETIKSIVEICETFKERGKTTKFWLCTNGTINRKEIFYFLDKHRFNIGVSLDGTRKDNDNYRVFRDGQSSYHLVINTLKDILTEDTYTRNLKNVWGLVVVTSETQSLVEILRHHKQVGLKRVQMRIVRTTEAYGLNENTFVAFKTLYNELFTFFIEQFKDDDIDYIEMISNDNDYLGKIMRRIILRRIVTNRCQAGKNKVSLTANGQLFPCDSFVGENEFCIGDALKKKRYNGILENIYVDGIAVCSTCWAKYICGGDCYHNSFLMKQSVEEVDYMFCKLQKHLIEQTVAMYCQMNDINAALFGKLARKIEISVREGIN